MRKKTLFKRVMALGLSTMLTLSGGNVAAAQEIFLDDAQAGEELMEDELILEDEQELVEEETQEEEIIDETGDEVDFSFGDEELPEGLCGMPEGYIPSEEEMESKKEAAEMLSGMLESLYSADYEEGVIIYSAENWEYAKEIATAYNAELESFSYGIAKARITDSGLTVADAVAAGANLSLALPAVSPNYFVTIEEPVASEVYTGSEEEAELMADGPSSNWFYYSEMYQDPALFPGYTFMEKNAFYPTDDGEEKAGYQWMHDMVGTYEAWGTTMGTNNVTVAVIDTGIDVNHEDFKADGQTRTVTSYNNIYPSWTDSSGHGTHVAGIIGAAVNKVGGIGMAPGVNILGIPIFYYQERQTGCEEISIARAIKYVSGWNGDTDTGIRRAEIINMSFGGPGYSQTTKDAIDEAHERGITMVASMGNEHTNDYGYPAAYENTIAVAAVDRDGKRADFSTYGEWADISAPGENIFSAWNGHDTNIAGEIKEDDHHNWYASWGGTSMAAPVVSGACALYMSAMGYTKPEDMERILKSTATKTKEKGMGAGIVNVAAMLPDTAKDKALSAPVIKVCREGKSEYVPIENGAILSKNDRIWIDAPENGTAFVVGCTVNGKNPSFKDGVADSNTYSLLANRYFPASNLIYYGAEPGKKFALKAVYVSPQGTVGKVTTLKDIIVESDDALEKITVYGPAYVAAGKSVTYTGRTIPANYAKKGFVWRIVDSNGVDIKDKNISINSKTGKLTVKKAATINTSFYVVASVNGDTSETPVYGVLGPVVVKGALKGVEIKLSGEPDKEIYAQKVNKKGEVSAVRVFNHDILSTEVNENQILIDLFAKVDETYGADKSELTAFSSRPGVATVAFDKDLGKWVIAGGETPGVAKITWAAVDGSGKKGTLSVTNIAPVSDITVLSKDRQGDVGFGKSIQLVAVPGNTYGKPSITKMTWDFKVTGYFGLSVKKDITQYVKEKKLVTVNAAGKVTVSKKYPELMAELAKGYGSDYSSSDVEVIATATDGSRTSGSIVLHPDSAITALAVGVVGDKEDQLNWFDKSFEFDLEYPKNAEKNTPYLWYVYVDEKGLGYPKTNLVDATSSNPELIYVWEPEVKQFGDKWYVCYPLYARGAGTAKITFTSSDGTKKKFVMDVKVELEKEQEKP